MTPQEKESGYIGKEKREGKERNQEARIISKAWEFSELYLWALKFANVCRSPLVEIEDAIQEMCLTAIECASADSPAYLKQAMRNKYLNLIRESKVRQLYSPSSTDKEDFLHPSYCEDGMLEARDLLERVFEYDRSYILISLLKGQSLEEISVRMKLSVRTVYRYILKLRSVYLN